MKRRTGFSYIIAVFCASLLLVSACSQSSPIIVASPAKGSVGSVDAGTLYPMIQSVSPGSLQSLDIPEAVQTGVLPSAPGISVVFTRSMANANGEMDTAFELFEAGSSDAVPVSVSPAASASYFLITPSYASSTGIPSGSLKPSTTYLLRIYKKAYAETFLPVASVSRSSNVATVVTSAAHGLVTGQRVSVSGVVTAGFNAVNVGVTVVDTTTFTYANTGADRGTTAEAAANVETFSRTLVFHNLVEAPATTISPADPVYVVYSFTTGTDADADTQLPSLVQCYPSDGALGIDPSAPAGSDADGGYIQFEFADNLVPMIDPSTVNDLSVTLRNDTDSNFALGTIVYVAADSIGCVWTDTDFKTFRFYTNSLLSGKHYTLQIGVDGPPSYHITDFAGNAALPVSVGFTTQ